MAVETPDYDALAHDTDLRDIASCSNNLYVLSLMQQRDTPGYRIKNLSIVDIDRGDTGSTTFIVGEREELGWLAYFIGKSRMLDYLYIRYLPEGRDEVNRFIEGMSQNRSIKHLDIRIDIGADGWSRLGGFFENNCNLSNFELVPHSQIIGNESAQNLALALGQMNHNFLTDLRICETGIGDEGMVGIVAALESQSQLECLMLDSNNIGRNSCIALGNTLSRWPSSNNLDTLYIDNNAIDDRGLQALAEGMMNCCNLSTIYLNDNPLITAAGLRYLSPLLQSEAHSLRVLRVTRIDWGDDGAIALAEGLRGNKSLRELRFRPSTAGMTSVGWSAFSKLLCDTSTINSTYLSNHTLTRVGCSDYEETPEDIRSYLRVNHWSRKSAVAIYKILRSHPDLDMEPFFKLKMQFLPAVMSWFERVEYIEDNLIEHELIDESERRCQNRKLSALYKFVRGMPDLTIIGYWEGRVIEIEANKCRIADEKRRLDDERRRLDDEERRLEYEEKVTLERLGDQPMDELNRNNKRMRLK
ncbi:hypothetical protein ACHAWC_010922 [Mediolabrus comicus]